MELIELGVIGVGLFFNGVLDLRKREVSLVSIGICAAVGILLRLVDGVKGEEFIYSLVPGILILFLAWISREQIGYGDGFMVLGCGACLSVQKLVLLLMDAFFISGIVGLFLLCFRKKKGKDRIPFVPFLCLGYLITCGLGGQ